MLNKKMTGLGGLNRKPLGALNLNKSKSDSASKNEVPVEVKKVYEEVIASKDSPMNQEESTAPNSIEKTPPKTPPKPSLVMGSKPSGLVMGGGPKKPISHLNNIKERIAAINAANATKQQA
jgi:hypothetical protein